MKDRGCGWWALGYKSYDEYLASDYWKEKREWILNVKGKQCEKCGSIKKLNVHHINYASVGNENTHDVTVLCYDCHKEEKHG